MHEKLVGTRTNYQTTEDANTSAVNRIVACSTADAGGRSHAAARARIQDSRRISMSEYTTVMFGTMEQGQADFAATYSSLQSTVSNLDSQLRANLAEWDGAAQPAYYAAKAKWDAAMADMANVVNQLGEVVGTANENYPPRRGPTRRCGPDLRLSRAARMPRSAAPRPLQERVADGSGGLSRSAGRFVMGGYGDALALEDQDKLDQQQAAANARLYNPDGSAKANDFHPPKLPESTFPPSLAGGTS